MGMRELRRIGVTPVLIGGALLSNGVTAQAGFFATSSCSLAEVYDDNLFLSASQPQEDIISRLSPTIEAGYRSIPLTLQGRYILDAESYVRHTELDTNRARAHTTLDFRYQPTRLLTVSADASYTETQRPGELNLETGVALERAQAERLSLGPAVVYRFDSLTLGTAAYIFTRDTLAGGLGTDTHTATLGFNRRIAPQDTAGVGYTFRRFVFGDTDAATSHVFTVSGTHVFTTRTIASFMGGPRFSDGSIDPEVSASIRHTLKRGELSLGYARSQTTVIGQAGAVDTRTYGAAVAYALRPSLELRAVPSFLSSTRGALRADVYRMSLEANYGIGKSWLLTGSYQFNLQRGNLDTPMGDEIARNVFLLGVAVTSSARTDTVLRTPGPRPPAELDASR